MRRSLVTPRRGLVLVALLLLLASVLPGRAVSWLGNPARNLVAAALIPVELPLKRLSDTVRRPEPIEVAVDDEYHPGQAVARLRQLELTIEALRRENHALHQIKAVLGDRPDVGRVTARVSATSGDRVNPTLRINHGSRAGIARRQAVVAGFALVGEVEHAGPVHADVRLITAAETLLSVRIIPPTSAEPLRQYQASMVVNADRQSFTIKADHDEPIEVDDWAHLADDRWPREAQGFVVARVVDVRRDPDDPLRLKLATLEPIVPLLSLHQVTVLVPGD
ncbi:MAG: rod shape-determining protein MreC [Phycisphaeraceae bacterium]